MDLDDPRWGIIGVIFGIIMFVAGLFLAFFTLTNARLQCLGFLIIIGTLASLGVTYQKLRKSKHLTYQVVSNTLLLSVEEKEELKGRIQVLLDNKPVGDVRLVVLRIWNSGNLSIKSEDYKEPVVIDFGMLAEILEVKNPHESVKCTFTVNGGK